MNNSIFLVIPMKSESPSLFSSNPVTQKDPTPFNMDSVSKALSTSRYAKYARA